MWVEVFVWTQNAETRGRETLMCRQAGWVVTVWRNMVRVFSGGPEMLRAKQRDAGNSQHGGRKKAQA